MLMREDDLVTLARVGIVLGRFRGWRATTPTGTGELAGLTETLIGDADGIYHPALQR
ncbi:hypothetical protein NKH85_32055 [Mesorhizobium sp. M0924]|uniref:hypothetical protein n=1 Tax=unclassified Mesorhizobium TaxID=325217 RepID=UPI00333C9312